MSTESSNRPELLPHEREALESFLRLEITSDELKKRLARIARFTGTESERGVQPLFKAAQPGIRVSRLHLENALNKKRLGQITERQLAEWASILLLLSDAYDFDSAHGGEVADWLNDLSWLPADGQE